MIFVYLYYVYNIIFIFFHDDNNTIIMHTTHVRPSVRVATRARACVRAYRLRRHRLASSPSDLISVVYSVETA